MKYLKQRVSSFLIHCQAGFIYNNAQCSREYKHGINCMDYYLFCCRTLLLFDRNFANLWLFYIGKMVHVDIERLQSVCLVKWADRYCDVLLNWLSCNTLNITESRILSWVNLPFPLLLDAESYSKGIKTYKWNVVSAVHLANSNEMWLWPCKIKRLVSQCVFQPGGEYWTQSDCKTVALF